MPEPTDEELGLPADDGSLDPNIRKELRASRIAKRELEAEKAANQSAQRELAILKAGIPESPARDLFLKAYDGPVTTEAIKTEAERYGLMAPPAGTGAGGPTAEELAAQQRIAGAGATGDTPVDEAARAAFTAQLRQAKNSDEVMALIRSADPALGVFAKGLQ